MVEQLEGTLQRVGGGLGCVGGALFTAMAHASFEVVGPFPLPPRAMVLHGRVYRPCCLMDLSDSNFLPRLHSIWQR